MLRRASLLAATLVALPALEACKTKCVDPGDDSAGVDRDTMLKLQKGLERNEALCSELGAPRVSVSGLDVVLTGPAGDRPVTKRADLSTEAPARIDPLFNRLKSYREMWKMLHPGQDFPGRADFTFDPNLEAVRAISVMLTTGFAGFPFARVTSGTATLDFTMFLPHPPQPEEQEPKPDRVLFVEIADATWSVRLYDRAKCGRDVEQAKVAKDAVAATVGRFCAGKPAPCATAIALRVRPGDRAEDMMKLARDVIMAYPEAKKPELALAAGPGAGNLPWQGTEYPRPNRPSVFGGCP
jgi:hypothetical protein